MTQRKSELLGMPFTTARQRLQRTLLFKLITDAGRNHCHRCGHPIVVEDDFTLEHKDAWMLADDPAAAFFSLENVAFSHSLCNTMASRSKLKKYASPQEKGRANNRKNQARRVEQRRQWRQSRRERGLPYT